MRNVIISAPVTQKMTLLAYYLTDEQKLSAYAVIKYMDRMNTFLSSLSAPVNHPKCRFEEWIMLEYRCAIFEKEWIFVYEEFDDGVLIRDLRHTKTMIK